MCAKVSKNMIKFCRGLTRSSKIVKKIRQSKIKKKFTFKTRPKFCPRIRQKKKNKKQEENLKKNLHKSSNFKTRDERKVMYDNIYKINAKNRKKNFFSKKFSIPKIDQITKNILQLRKIREKRRRGRVTVEREDASIDAFCKNLRAFYFQNKIAILMLTFL